MKEKNESNPVKIEKEAKEKKHAKETDGNNEKLALIRIRGEVGIRKPIKDTLLMLRLYRRNFCTVVEKNSIYVGMAKKIKDYSTYGEIDADTYKLLVEKRGEKNEKGELKKYFRLNSPKKGFERKGIKVSFTKGGALGYRGKKINDLIKRMV